AHYLPLRAGRWRLAWCGLSGRGRAGRHGLALLGDVEGALLVPGEAGDRLPAVVVLAVGLGAGDERLLEGAVGRLAGEETGVVLDVLHHHPRRRAELLPLGDPPLG